MTKTINVEGEVDSEIWESFKKNFPKLDDASIFDTIISEYSKLIQEGTTEGNVLSELDDKHKLTESLRKKCKNFALRVKELEDIQVDQENNISKLKKQIKKISKGIPDFGEDAPVKERIVYREDTKTLNELKEKRDGLQKTLWEKNAELDNLEKVNSELKHSLEKFEAEKGKAYAILVRLSLNKETSKYEFIFENISMGEFNKLMRSKVEFCKYKKIFTPASVIKLWESDLEESGIIDLDDAVNELRTKPENKLTEVSLPHAQYDNLKKFESKYHGIKEELEELKTSQNTLTDRNKQLSTEHEKIKEELKNLKENPIVKEKIVYKDNTKELEDLTSECERLRLKLFNYETGQMKVPTHGINVGNTYRVKILGVGKDGDGFTRVNNFIVFVPNTNKDQEVNVKVTRVLKKYAFGKILEGEPDDSLMDATQGAVPVDEKE